MNFFKKKSDRDVVDALRRTERFRQLGGLSFIVLGLAFVGFHVWGEAWMKSKAVQIANSVSDIQRSARFETPDQPAPIAYAVGFRSGLLFSQGMNLRTRGVSSGPKRRRATRFSMSTDAKKNGMHR